VCVTRHDIVVNTFDYVVLAYYREASVESGLASVEALAGCGARIVENEKELCVGDAVEWATPPASEKKL
jgi:hypothetical protein